jgi:hypothetical protein
MANRLRVLSLAVTLLLAAPLATEVQQAGRVYRVGFLSLGARPAQHGMWHTLLEAMRELNYVEGQNLIVSIAFAEGKSERLPGLAAELIQAKVDVALDAAGCRGRRAAAGRVAVDTAKFRRSARSLGTNTSHSVSVTSERTRRIARNGRRRRPGEHGVFCSA